MNEHAHEIKRSTFRPDHFNVACECGYRSGPWPYRSDAEHDADEHVLAMASAGSAEGEHRPEVTS